MSRYFGFDFRSMIHSIKTGLNKDMEQIALQIHIVLQYNSLKYHVYRKNTLNRLLTIFQFSYRYRKITVISSEKKKFIII